MIDEHALQLVANRLVQQHGHDRGVHATRQAADHAAGADLGADAAMAAKGAFDSGWEKVTDRGERLSQ
jgi:hypothetical protein